MNMIHDTYGLRNPTLGEPPSVYALEHLLRTASPEKLQPMLCRGVEWAGESAAAVGEAGCEYAEYSRWVALQQACWLAETAARIAKVSERVHVIERLLASAP